MSADLTSTTEQEWETVLDLLEVDVASAERAVAGTPTAPVAWTVPTVAGRVPAALRPRAQELLRRQQAVLTALPVALTRAARQQAVTARIGRAVGRGSTRPVYIDTSA